MTSRHSHYRTAELLLAEGVDVLGKLSETDQVREAIIAKPTGDDDSIAYMTPEQQGVINALTDRMDELGKKAMGIWAQAQVHATLATTGKWA